VAAYRQRRGDRSASAGVARGRVTVAWAFGSGVTGTARHDSDADIAVLARPDRAPLDVLELSRLSNRLHRLVAGEPDLVAFERAALPLQARIVLTGAVLFSDDEPLRVRTTVLVQSRWEDIRGPLAEMDRAYITGIAEHGLDDFAQAYAKATDPSASGGRS
jgi:predicted nucleotidyltransferase